MVSAKKGLGKRAAQTIDEKPPLSLKDEPKRSDTTSINVGPLVFRYREGEGYANLTISFPADRGQISTPNGIKPIGDLLELDVETDPARLGRTRCKNWVSFTTWRPRGDATPMVLRLRELAEFLVGVADEWA